MLYFGLTLAARSGGHPDDQQESDRHDSQHFERPEMMDHQAAGAVGVFLPLAREWLLRLPQIAEGKLAEISGPSQIVRPSGGMISGIRTMQSE